MKKYYSINLIRNLTLVLVFLAVASSCQKINVAPKVADTEQIKFAVNWSKINPNAPTPQGAKLWLYHQETPNVPIVIDVDNFTTTETHLKTGVYNIITYNKNAQNLIVSGDTSFDTHRGTIKQVEAPKIGLAPTEYTAINGADYIHTLVGSAPRIITVEPNKPILVTLQPKTVNHNINITFSINGHEAIKDGVAQITEMDSHIMFGNAVAHSDFPAKIVMPITKISQDPTTKAETLVAQTSALGTFKKEDGTLNTVLSFTMRFEDPKIPNISFSKDISDKLESLEDENYNPHVQIEDKNVVPIITVTIIPFEDEVFPGDIIILPL